MNITISFFESKNISEIIANWIKDYIGIFLLTYSFIKNVNSVLGMLMMIIGFILLKANIEIKKEKK